MSRCLRWSDPRGGKGTVVDKVQRCVGTGQGLQGPFGEMIRVRADIASRQDPFEQDPFETGSFRDTHDS